MCQRLHGNYGPHSKAKKVDLVITNDVGLSWYETSDIARRGFCRECGSGLFWDAYSQDATGIVAGTLDDTSSLKTIGNIFVAEKPGYYELNDDLPQFSGSSNGGLDGDYR